MSPLRANGTAARCARLIGAEIRSELRGDGGLYTGFFLSLLLVLLYSFGVLGAFIEREVIYRLVPTFIWGVFLVSASLRVTSTVARELSEDTISVLHTLSISPALLFRVKVVALGALLLIEHFLTTALWMVFLNIPLFSSEASTPTVPWFPSLGAGDPYLWYGALSLLVVVGYVSLAIVISAIFHRARLQSMVGSLLLLPLLFPLFFAAVELTIPLLALSGAEPGAPSTPWWSLLFGFSLVYLMLGDLLIGVALQE